MRAAAALAGTDSRTDACAFCRAYPCAVASSDGAPNAHAHAGAHISAFVGAHGGAHDVAHDGTKPLADGRALAVSDTGRALSGRQALLLPPGDARCTGQVQPSGERVCRLPAGQICGRRRARVRGVPTGTVEPPSCVCG